MNEDAFYGCGLALLLTLIGLLIIVGVRWVRSLGTSEPTLSLRYFLQLSGGIILLAGLVMVIGLSVLVAIAVVAGGADVESLFTAIGGAIAGLPLVLIGILFLSSARALRDSSQALQGSGFDHHFRMAEGFGAVLVLLGTGGLAVPVLLAGLVLRLAQSGRQSRQGRLLWSLAIAAREQLPLLPEIEDHSRTVTGREQIQARDAARLLRSGYTLSDTLQLNPLLLPASAVLAIRVGEKSGVLPRTLKAEAQRNRERHRDVSGDSILGGLLPGYLILIGGIPLLYLAQTLLPRFRHIWDDFGIELPEITKQFSALATLIVSNWWLVLALLLLLCVVVAGLIRTGMGFLRGEEQSLPILGRLFPGLHGPLVLRSLALVVEAGRPLPSGLSVLAEDYPQKRIGRRLKRVAEQVEAGDSPWKGLVEQGFLRRRDADVLVAAERAGNLAWALRTIADRIHGRRLHRFRLLCELALPLMVLAMGALVLFVAVAFFYPLVTLLQTLGEEAASL